LPPAVLSPNARVHWGAKAKAVKRYRETANLTARAALGRRDVPMQQARVTARFFFVDRRRRDRDNLLASLKPAFDGLADAHMIANDAGMTHMPVEIAVDRDYPRVEIEIEKL
jgi:Holliday junction resolvase RusA-like endonuclease